MLNYISKELQVGVIYTNLSEYMSLDSPLPPAWDSGQRGPVKIWLKQVLSNLVVDVLGQPVHIR